MRIVAVLVASLLGCSSKHPPPTDGGSDAASACRISAGARQLLREAAFRALSDANYTLGNTSGNAGGLDRAFDANLIGGQYATATHVTLAQACSGASPPGVETCQMCDAQPCPVAKSCFTLACQAAGVDTLHARWTPAPIDYTTDPAKFPLLPATPVHYAEEPTADFTYDVTTGSRVVTWSERQRASATAGSETIDLSSTLSGSGKVDPTGPSALALTMTFSAVVPSHLLTVTLSSPSGNAMAATGKVELDGAQVETWSSGGGSSAPDFAWDPACGT